MFSNIIYKIEFFLTKCKWVIEWLPIIWNDRDYDHSYLYKLLAFKLKKIHRYLGQSKIVHYSKKNLRRIKTAEVLCNRLIYDDVYYVAPDWKCNKVDSLFRKGETINLPDWKFVEKRRQADMELFCKIIQKHSNRWWE